MICCVCGVLVAPLDDECWKRASTALQMAASAGYGLIAVGRLFALLAGELLPLGIERLYVWAGALLFTACGGVALGAAATGDSAWGPAEQWEAREVARAVLALLAAAVLAVDALTCHLPAQPPPHDDLEAPPVRELPPPYSVAVAQRPCPLPQ